MGAKSAMLVFSEGRAADRLRVAARESDEAAAAALVARVHPGSTVEPAPGESLWDGTYPPDGTCYAASFDGVEIVCDRRLMEHRPSLMPRHLLAAGRGDRVFFHAMHSVLDTLTFAVWERGALVRSLSLAPDGGIVENIGVPYEFEAPFWTGERPVEPDPWWREGQTAYPLAFHPLELGEEALRAFAGFVLEGRLLPDDVDADAVQLNGFRVTDPSGPDPARARAELELRVAAMRLRSHTTIQFGAGHGQDGV
ncbi:DUF6928 family protein [Streptacidiphilus fuscans]|uniref:Uncharacterized protein n=1 Tax=Streptacidiphilus fuscans TaxID=2789292 RepID=A0A931FHZ6_9ACTN|nr:hypothetical protein [Streptacidiphilus fuscans]MBF9072366.1 hypothetical protein [Streptacidiphilus fuscans]